MMADEIVVFMRFILSASLGYSRQWISRTAKGMQAKNSVRSGAWVQLCKIACCLDGKNVCAARNNAIDRRPMCGLFSVAKSSATEQPPLLVVFRSWKWEKSAQQQHKGFLALTFERKAFGRRGRQQKQKERADCGRTLRRWNGRKNKKLTGKLAGCSLKTNKPTCGARDSYKKK